MNGRKSEYAYAYAEHGFKLVWFDNNMGYWWMDLDSHSDAVESYDIYTDTWRTETSLPKPGAGMLHG